MTTPSTPLNS